MFDQINKILYKTKTATADSLQDNKEFVPFLVQRWCSMHSPEVATLINQTSNRVWPILESKDMWFNYLNGILPQCKYKRISYIKKKKDTEAIAKNKEIVKTVANNLEISLREVNLYVQQFNLDLPNEKK